MISNRRTVRRARQCCTGVGLAGAAAAAAAIISVAGGPVARAGTTFDAEFTPFLELFAAL